MRLTKAKFHFIGIGGVGMSGLAELLHNMGAKVSGSDLSKNTMTERLKNLGIEIHEGHREANITPEIGVVVYSSAVNWHNPEMKKARELKIPIIRRAEVLSEVMRLKRGIAIAGSHGKTTTTSLVASVLIHAHMDPTVVVGGRLDLIKSTAKLGQGAWLVAEADESDGSFLNLTPEIAVVTNIDNDHLDHYGSFENLKRTFFEFALKVPFYGLCIVCGDDPHNREVFDSYPKRLLTYGFEKHNDFQLVKTNSHYDIINAGKKIGSFQLGLPGKHNALNALSAFIVGLECGIAPDMISQGLESFKGVDRRFHFKGEAKNVIVYDDYGHHPTEVKAVVSAFKEKYPKNRLVVTFQPHRYSRTQLCWDGFLNCFELVDELFLLDIYPASEKPIEGITGEKLFDAIKIKNKTFVPKSASIEEKIFPHLKPGDVFVTLGAGDIWKIGESFLKTFK